MKSIILFRKLIRGFSLSCRLSDLSINELQIEYMVHFALKIQRFLKNNVREISYKDTVDIYLKAM